MSQPWENELHSLDSKSTVFPQGKERSERFLAGVTTITLVGAKTGKIIKKQVSGVKPASFTKKSKGGGGGGGGGN